MARLAADTAFTAKSSQFFDRLKPYLTGSTPAISFTEVADELDMTEAAVKTAVHRLRRSSSVGVAATAAHLAASRLLSSFHPTQKGVSFDSPSP